MPNKLLILERRGAVALIRLNRPAKRNALNARLSRELIAALDDLEADDGVHAVVITGSGQRAFCAGADMAEAVSSHSAGAPGAPAEAVARLLRFPKPVIAAVNGYAYGGGAALAANCDIRIAAPDARFRFLGAEYGLVVGASQLPRIVGGPRAKELIFSARVVEAAEAERIGLVNRVVPFHQLEAEALALAAAIAANVPAAVRASKEVIDLATDNSAAEAREADLNRELRRSEEHRQRFRAAAEKVTGSNPNGGLPSAPR